MNLFTRRGRAPALALLAAVGATGCSDPCVDDARCDDESAPAAQQAAAADAGASTPTTPVTVDAGAAPSGSGVTFSVEGSTRAKLVIEGARCEGLRCTFASVPAGGKVKVDLTLSNSGVSDMPVWVKWRGCSNYDGQLWPVWQTNPPSYETLYTHVFQGLTAGSHCVAEIAQGSWYVFAGNLSLKATKNAQWCRDQYSGPENLNLQCFIPAKETLSITGDLRSWQCYTDGVKRATAPVTHRQSSLSFTSVGHEIISCMGSAL